MSSSNGADTKQVLQLQQIEIQSAITRIRARLRIDGMAVAVQQGEDMCWRADRSVEVLPTSEIVLTVQTGHRPFKKEVETRICGSDLWKSLSGPDALISCSTVLSKQPMKVAFKFRVPPVATYDSACAALQQACDEMKGYRSLMGSSKLQQTVDAGLKIGIALSEMDPIAKAAFALAKTTFELLKEQQKYDELVPKLADSFGRILPFASIVAVDYEMSQTLQDIVEDLFNVVEKGAQFICQYVRRASINRFVVSLVSSEDRDAINRLQEDLAKIKEDFDRATAVDTLQMTKEAEEKALLQRLKPVESAIYDPERGCWKGTRTAILDDILQWTSDTSCAEKILWLHGIPGSGKTSVATSLCDLLHSDKTLAASFFCRRDDPILSKPSSVLPTLIYYLASTWGPYRKLVASALRTDEKLQPNQTKRIFHDLVVEPLGTLSKHPPCPLVIVIDALDEYGDIQSRSSLLLDLLTATSQVDWLKVILTSRPDHDIEEAFTQLGSNSYRHLDLYIANDTLTDIRHFAKEKLASLAKRRHLGDEWPGAERLDLIVTRSRGLFISVQTMWLLVKDEPDPDPLLEQLLEGETAELADTQLHELYKTILGVKVGSGLQAAARFRHVIGAVIAVADHRALCDDTLAALLGMKPNVVKSVVDDLASLLYREGVGIAAVRVRHLSIIDFVLGASCPELFRVDAQETNAKLTSGCFNIMTKELRFNICRLETSSLVNDKVKDMADRIDRWISDGLHYSCLQWASHLEPVMFDAKIFGYIQDFMQDQFLFWLEVLSVTKCTGLASRMLLLLIGWMQNGKQDDAMGRDMHKFVETFLSVISQSAPHVYLSALPFAPRNSYVAERYMKLYPRTLAVQTGGYSDWPSLQNVLFGHTNTVHSVAFSPDGRCIVSGSWDNTIRLWDAHTGESIGGPFEGHIKDVNSVAFSPDGKFIVSGSDDMTVRVWHAGTGEAIGAPFGLTEEVHSVAFSPDNKHIVSGDENGTVQVWDAETGKPVGGPSGGHTRLVHSVAFSHDGGRIVSGSWDKTIRLWDAHTGKAIGGPFEGHTDLVTSVAFSHGGERIVSGSWDKTIRLWNPETGEVVGAPFKGHSDSVASVVFLPNGQRIVSGSWDKTIRLWDAHTGEPIGEPFDGHTASARSVAVSPDGKRIVSGSDDGTVRVWDAETEETIAGRFEGHTDSVNSVAFSPDGKRIISGSDDATVRVWDAVTGEAVGKPFNGHTGWVKSVAFSPDDKRIVSSPDDETVRVWDAETEETIADRFEGYTGSVNSVAFSPDGRHIISGSIDNRVRVWGSETGGPVQALLEGHTKSVLSVAFSPDGKHIVSGSSDQTVRVWDAATGEAIGKPFRGHTDWVRSVAFSPDGRRIVSGSDDKTVCVWDAVTGEAVGKPFNGHTGWVKSVAFSPDDKRIVSGSYDRTVRVWCSETGGAVGIPFEGHTSSVMSIALSPDGKRIVSGSDDKTVRVWDSETGEAVGAPFNGHTGTVTSVRFSLDGERIVSGSDDKTVRVWDAEPDSLIKSPLSRSDMMDGWLLDSNSEPLFWVPPHIRAGLMRNGATLIIGRVLKTTLDLQSFVHGESWTLCREVGDVH